MFGNLKVSGRALCASVAFLTAGIVLATDYQWANASDPAAKWDEAANWRAGGAAAASQPLTADDTAAIPSATAFLQTISWTTGTWSPSANRTLGAIDGGDGVQLAFDARDGKITIANPSGFTGVFRMEQARGVLQSASTADATPTFRAVNARNWTKINNLGAEGRLVVGSAFGEGRVSVNAGYNEDDHLMIASTVEIGETGGPAQEVKVNRGKVVFRGRAKRVPPAVADGAWMHLDASVAGSVELAGDGKVVKWKDVRGNGVFAGPYQPAWASEALNCPTVVANWANGLPAVDFGLYSGTKATVEGGSSYAGAEWFSNSKREGNPSALAWCERRADIKEVVFVFADTSSTNYPTGVHVTSPYVIGDGAGDSFARGDTGRLFANNAAFDMRATLNGEVRVNGHRVSYDHAENYACGPFVVSVRGAGNLAGAVFGASGRACRNDSSRDLHLGGIRLGEVLVYTRALTDAERAALEQYLMAKWCPEEALLRAEEDLALLDLSAKDAQASFEEGTFTVGELMLPAGATSFAKTGSGTLEVGRMPASCTRIAVEEGGLALRQRLVPAPDATKGPAADPQVWLDATKGDSFEYDGEKVTKWTDWRTDLTRNRTYATANIPSSGNLPTRNAADAGRPYVDFGPMKSSAAESIAQVLKDYDGRTLEAFVVYRNHADMEKNYPFAGDGFVSSDDESRLQALWYNGADQLSATFRQNGVTLNTETAKVDPTSMKSFAVYSVRLTGACNLQYMACDRGGDYGYPSGGCDIAEVLYYDRRLTEAERADTEAYLMGKWLGKEHPGTVRLTSLASVSFAEGVKPTLGSDEPIVLGNVDGSGEFVKTGSGDMDIGKISGFEGLAVEGGSLTAEEDMMGDAYFHVDASAADSLVMVEGGERQEIARWNDVRGNGRYAKAVVEDLGNGENKLQYPRLNASAGAGWAEGRPTVDFLGRARPLAGDEPAYGEEECATMHWYDENGSHDGSLDIREVHVVYCENGLDGTAAYSPGGSWMGYASYGNYSTKGSDLGKQFLRDGIGRLFAGYWSPVAAAAVMRIDGEPTSNGEYVPNAEANKHFHVLSMSMAEATHANFFCNDRGNCGAGGYRLAEVVVFTGNTNSYEKFQAINDYLCKKWRDIGEGGGYTALKSLRATGGTLNVSAATGTLEPREGAALEFSLGADGVRGQINVDGTFAFPATGTLTVTVDPVLLNPGRYVLLKADRLSGVENFANWVRVIGSAPMRFLTVRIDAANGELALKVSNGGSVIMVR